MNKSLVIGYGSIGKRHANVLSQLGCDVKLITTQPTNTFIAYSSVSEALDKHVFDYVIIANETHLHFPTLQMLMHEGFCGTVLIEKPLFANLHTLPVYPFKQLFVGYNLRFSKPLQLIKQWIAKDQLISFSVNVGQYLPTWRPNRDYRLSYSAKKELGGGVLTDLSHELDYSVWLCGRPLEVTARGGKFSNLQISSDDIYSVMMRCQACPIVNIQMNYLDRIKRREILIQTHNHTFYIDLIKGLLFRDGEPIETEDMLSLTYTRQHEAILHNNYADVCTYAEGLSTVKLIHTIYEANKTSTWITT